VAALESDYFVLVEHALVEMDKHVGTLTGVLNATEGRDKLLKIGQYGLRTFCYLTGTAFLAKRTRENLLGLASACSLTRKFLKLGMQLAIGRVLSQVIQNDLLVHYKELLHDYDAQQARLNGADIKGSQDDPLNKSHRSDNPLVPKVTFRLKPGLSRGADDDNDKGLWRHFVVIWRFLSRPKAWIKLLAVGRLLGLIVYFTGDNLVWGVHVKMLHNGDKKMKKLYQYRALSAHVISCVCAMLLNSYQAMKNARKLLEIRKKIRINEKFLEKKINLLSLDQHTDNFHTQEWLEYHLAKVHSKMHNLRVTTSKLILDALCSSNVVFRLGLSDSLTAIMSLTSALMAIRQLWRRIESGNYNPCKQSTEAKKKSTADLQKLKIRARSHGNLARAQEIKAPN